MQAWKCTKNISSRFKTNLKDMISVCIEYSNLFYIHTCCINLCYFLCHAATMQMWWEREMFSFMSSFMIASWIWQKREKYGVYFSYWGLYSLKYRQFSYRYYTWLKWWLVNITIAKKHFFKIFSKFWSIRFRISKK